MFLNLVFTLEKLEKHNMLKDAIPEENLLLFGHCPNGLDPPGTFFRAKRSPGKCFHLGHFFVQTQDKKKFLKQFGLGSTPLPVGNV